MFIKGDKIKVPIMALNLILMLLYITAVESRKLDETPMPAVNGTDEKCAPCGYTSPPPPSPAIPPPSPPPPSPKKPPSPSTVYCPPPPAPSSSSYIYITGPPGELYPIDTNFSGANHKSHHRSFFLPLLIGLFITVVAFW
uniref:Uncharacterized protein n=1 Tax=Lotus japonicus TaxID=34305 RepID=I3T6J5_LOTJA|nr:unknown [Lotus japonicus]